MPRYNGHKNWNHWNVSLWINNDEHLYRMALNCLQDAKRHGSDRAHAVGWMLGRLPKKTPDGAPYTASSVRAAMAGMTV
jgi:hypothetical protein